MKVLLTNDDGFNAPGILALEKELEKNGHEIWVCAPDRQRSGVSHSITIGKSLNLKQISPKHYTCSGSPADCIMYLFEADKSGFIKMGKPDAVISGINYGYNMGRDLVYSGTVGCASEAALFSIPAIAVSATISDNPPYKDAAVFTSLHLEDFIKLIEPHSFISINVPENSNLEWKTTCTDFNSFYVNYLKKDSEDSYTLCGDARKEFENGSGRNMPLSELEAVWFYNKISVAPIRVIPVMNNLMYRKLESLEK